MDEQGEEEEGNENEGEEKDTQISIELNLMQAAMLNKLFPTQFKFLDMESIKKMN